MKASVSMQELQEHKKFLSSVKPKSARLAAASEITLSVSEVFRVTGYGIQHDIPCKPLKWGTVMLPFQTWSKLITIVSQSLTGEYVTIEAGSGYILFDHIKFKNPDIKETTSNNLAYEMPVDADKGKIRSLILEAYTIDQIQNSGLWGVYETIMEEIGSNALKAHKRLSRYGVSLDDITQILLKTLKVKDRNFFIQYLKEKSQEKPPK